MKCLLRHIPPTRSLVAIAAVLLIVGALPVTSDGAGPRGGLLGVYPSAALSNPAAIAEIQAIDAWAAQVGGVKTTFAGSFMGLRLGNPSFEVPAQFENAWSNGYTPLVNITDRKTGLSAQEIADGGADQDIRAWAQAIRQWAVGGRTVYLAPLPEMNLGNDDYGLDPAGFREAWRRFRDIFAEENVPTEAVRWIFAPNGWTAPDDPDLEEYYPGDHLVDGVGFSQFNWGFCIPQDDGVPRQPGTCPWNEWQSPEAEFGEIFTRLRALAPNRPIFILQTGTTSFAIGPTSCDGSECTCAAGSSSTTMKNQWLQDAYAYFAEEGVAGVMFFNKDKECDWAFFDDSQRYTGYRLAAASGAYEYIPPVELGEIALLPAGGCTNTPDALCALAGRFRVEGLWRNPSTGASGPTRLVPGLRADQSGVFYWAEGFSSSNWELLVKVLDFCNQVDGYRVFANAATNLYYEIHIVDTWTGQRWLHVQPSGKSRYINEVAFETCAASSPFEAAVPSRITDSSPARPTAICSGTDDEMCAHDGRFRAYIDWEGFRGNSGRARLLPASATSDESGLYYFTSDQNWEAIVKVNENGCKQNGHFWVFAAVASNNAWTLTVEDTEFGLSRTYSNALGQASEAVTDNTAFATCP